MKIVVAGGSNAAQYIIRNFKNKENSLVVINNDKIDAQKISFDNNIPVIFGDPSKRFLLESAHIEDFDIFISVSESDVDNFAACLMAKKAFNVKKCICIVQNPNNVEIFKELGIDAVLSSTQLLIDSINSESSLEKLIKTMSYEDNKVSITEVVIKSNYLICHKSLAEINFPKNGSIACIFRKTGVIIPNGQTILMPKDKLMFVSAPKDQQQIIDFITKESKNEKVKTI